MDNCSCPYCGTVLTEDTITKEHVIGRRFVPKGLFNGSWNLIVQACRDCNGIKADLENDISAITLLPDGVGGWSNDGPDVSAEAQHRAGRTFSRRTRKPVAESQEGIEIDGELMPGVQVKFTLNSPPQIAEDRVFHLAWFHLAGFFYWITYDPEAKRGHYWTGVYMPLLITRRSDWGNPIASAFAKEVYGWEPRVMATTKDAFFKIAIRRHPSSETWSFALEWNRSHRIIGFLGDETTARGVAAEFPELAWKEGPAHAGTRTRYRTETPLEGDDILFGYDDAEPPGS